MMGLKLKDWIFFLACGLMAWAACSSSVRSALGARLAYADAEVPSYTVADYVQDGLCAIWDGIDNAGVGIHDDTLAQWRDLIGECPLIWDVSKCTWEKNAIANYTTSNAQTLRQMASIGYPWWNSIGIFSETEREGYFSVGNYTIEIVARSSVNTALFHPYSANGFAGFAYGSPWSSFRLIFSPANGWAGGGRYSGFILKGLENVPINFSGVARPTGGSQLFANGKLVVESDVVLESAYMNLRQYTLFTVPANGGAVYCLRIYNRALEEHEVVHNYRVDKVRFGL